MLPWQARKRQTKLPFRVVRNEETIPIRLVSNAARQAVANHGSTVPEAMSDGGMQAIATADRRFGMGNRFRRLLAVPELCDRRRQGHGLRLGAQSLCQSL